MTPKALADLHALCFIVPRPFSAQEFSELLSSDLVFLCLHSSGFALGRAVADEAELLTLAVDPTHRRIGIGRILLDDFAKQALHRGAGRLFLEVAAGNIAARALYDASGYAESGTRRAYYRAPDGRTVDAIVMSKRLDRD